MNREEFILELRSKLTRLSNDELEAALGYYEEYFDEAGPENESAVINELGNPSQIAKQIMADLAIKEVAVRPQSTKQGIKTIWIVLLAILASPIALPLAIAALALVFAAVVTVGSVLFAVGIVIFTFVIVGAVLIGAMFSILMIHPMTAVLYFGVAIVMFGVAILAGVLMYWLVGKCIPMGVRSEERRVGKECVNT